MKKVVGSRLCECKCGQPAPIGRRFIRWHHLKHYQKGSDNPRWTGDEATYQAIHSWIMRNGKKTGVCSKCNKSTTASKYRKSGTEWHNISGEYKRDVNDYIELCKPCHIREDKVKNVSTSGARTIRGKQK